MTDASRTRGLGYALLQKRAGTEETVLIQCGSRFITETERRYAMIELELLAVVWAMKKCRVYLVGLNNFRLMVDHNPLLPILNSKGIDEVENPRIIRLKEKLTPYKFKAEWRKGKDHKIPDALSRSPVTDPDDEDLALEAELTEALEYRINAMMTAPDTSINDEDNSSSYMDNTRDLILEDLVTAANEDPQYQELRALIANGFHGIKKTMDLPIHLRPYFKIRDDLSDIKGLALHQNKIIIPASKRRLMLDRLNASHQGIVRTLRRARTSIYWPGISSDIKNMVERCDACQEGRPSLAAEPRTTDQKPTRPFQETACDLFEYAGRQYLAYVDRFSNWIEVRRFGSHPDSDKIIEALMDLFSKFGTPQKFRTDGGKQFSSTKTRDFCKRWGVRQVFSAPNYPQSNGLAESAVKAAKKLLQRAKNQEEFYLGMLELMNTPGADNKSPAEKVFGAQTRSLVPSFLPVEQSSPRTSVSSHTPREHRPIVPGQQVRLQNKVSGRWDRLATVLRRAGRNYIVECKNTGNVLTRNRRHLIPCCLSAPEPEQQGMTAHDQQSGNSEETKKHVRFKVPDRRSERVRYKSMKSTK